MFEVTIRYRDGGWGKVWGSGSGERSDFRTRFEAGFWDGGRVIFGRRCWGTGVKIRFLS